MATLGKKKGLPEVEVSVMRLGTMEGRVSCKYETRDGSAEAGVRRRTPQPGFL